MRRAMKETVGQLDALRQPGVNESRLEQGSSPRRITAQKIKDVVTKKRSREVDEEDSMFLRKHFR
jgi:hypothetical protein